MVREIRNVVFIVLDAGWFGHTRTAFSISKSLVRNGVNVTYLIFSENSCNYISKNINGNDGMHVDYVSKSMTGSYDIFKALNRLSDKNKIDIVHIVESRCLYSVSRWCSLNKVPLVQTLCSSFKQRRYYPVDSVVFISEELRDQFNNAKQMANSLVVISNRVESDELSVLLNVYGQKKLGDEFKKKYDVPSNARIVMRIVQVSDWYVDGLFQCVADIESLVLKGNDLCFVHIGGGDLALIDDFKRCIDDAYERIGKIVAVTAQDEFANAAQYLPLADIIIGTGRGAFEAMYYKIPLIVQDFKASGFYDVVGSDNINEIAWYNFSGRHDSFDVDRSNLQYAVEIISENSRTNKQELELDLMRGYFDRNLDSSCCYDMYCEVYRNASFPNYTLFSSAFYFLKNAIQNIYLYLSAFRVRL